VLRRFPGDARDTISRTSIDVDNPTAHEDKQLVAARPRVEEDAQAAVAVKGSSVEFGQGESESLLDSFLTTLTVTGKCYDVTYCK
jgi:hypothetical protein